MNLIRMTEIIEDSSKVEMFLLHPLIDQEISIMIEKLVERKVK